MNRCFQAALVAAGLVALAGQAGAVETRLPPSLTAFGASAPITPFTAAILSEADLRGPAYRTSQDALGSDPVRLSTSFGTAAKPHQFVSSIALSAHLAIDAGYDVNLSQRFDNYDGVQSPLIADSGFLGLANSGHYAGATYMPTAGLHIRLGANQWSDRLDRLTLEPAAIGLPLAYDNGFSQSLLAGVSWDVSPWADLDLTALHNSQQNLGGISNLTSGRIDTDALEMTAHLKFGSGWVTTASYSQGLSQLDQRSQTPTLDTRSYSIAIAKHGLFGEDALGFSFSRPAMGMLDNSFSAVSASGNLPPSFITGDRFANQTQETDLQLGYVTSFLDGALALQTNAAYQMNYQGQNGATSVSLLSRAKIKF
ncbi:MAG: hypothetical protein V4559_09255 [Pseudomonadota bacterium]